MSAPVHVIIQKANVCSVWHFHKKKEIKSSLEICWCMLIIKVMRETHPFVGITSPIESINLVENATDIYEADDSV